MANVFMSKEATKDLEQIGDYIAHQFQSPKSAHNIVLKIKERIKKLEDFPLIGTPLSAIIATHTDYRFLGCGSYLAFYRHINGDVFIDRILHGRQDYISILLGDAQEDM